jgi:hypothetical protein
MQWRITDFTASLTNRSGLSPLVTKRRSSAIRCAPSQTLLAEVAREQRWLTTTEIGPRGEQEGGENGYDAALRENAN